MRAQKRDYRKTTRLNTEIQAKCAGFLLIAFGSASPVEQLSPTCYRGATPSTESLLDLRAKGIKTLVNVRTNPLPHIEEAARQLGMNYYHVRTGIFIAPGQEAVRQFLSIVRNPDKQPVYVFCNKGKDRTSFYAALEQIANGNPVDTVINDMCNHGLKCWWPTFSSYRELVRLNSNQIRKLASSLSEARSIAECGGFTSDKEPIMTTSSMPED